MTRWTSVKEIRAKVERIWNQGDLLRDLLRSGSGTIPIQIKLKCPTAQEISDHYPLVRDWIKELAVHSCEQSPQGYRIDYKQFNHRQLGKNSLPAAIWFDTIESALTIIERTEAGERFKELSSQLLTQCPELDPWIYRNPLHLIERDVQWDKLLKVLLWLKNSIPTHLYLRQIDIPDVDTKFIERHKPLLAELLEEIVPPERYDHTTPNFEQRFGFCSKPRYVRFRYIGEDESPFGFRDGAMRADEFSRCSPPIETVFITENEINFLSFPAARRSIVIFGGGYGFDGLRQVAWLSQKTLFYWGDIDTHGFAILDQLRQIFPHVRSFLMDRSTLEKHRLFWDREQSPTRRTLHNLTKEEQSLYAELCANILGDSVRLEQERVRFGVVKETVELLVRNGTFCNGDV
jgi:hypothetical protein